MKINTKFLIENPIILKNRSVCFLTIKYVRDQKNSPRRTILEGLTARDNFSISKMAKVTTCLLLFVIVVKINSLSIPFRPPRRYNPTNQQIRKVPTLDKQQPLHSELKNRKVVHQIWHKFGKK